MSYIKRFYNKITKILFNLKKNTSKTAKIYLWIDLILKFMTFLSNSAKNIVALAICMKKKYEKIKIFDILHEYVGKNVIKGL